MKSRLVFLILALAFSFIAFHFTPAYSDFLPDKKYLIQASGYLTGKQAIYDSTLALQLGTSGEAGSNWLSTLDNGVVTIADDNYLNSGIWQTTMLQYGKYLVISGDAQDVSGNTIHLNLFGKLIGSNQDGSVYRITGKIVATETMKVIFSAKVTLIVSNVTSQQTQQQPQQQIPQQTQPKTLPENQISAAPSKAQSPTSDVSAKKILLIAKQTSPISISYSYGINVKVFYADQNPTANFDQYYGVVPNANITAQILDSNGITVKSFEGLTDDHGYYFYNFRIPDNFVPGTYTVHVTAQIGSSLDSKTLTLFVRPYYG
ncbi:MAG: hypothetical protein AUH84_04520 [Thaumarchaeota archaeon 13_1_40CM_4_38_7]|nr:MAG: hypothetical protein AUH84_04520 [Thaumarchaeota archaeon 13_1_40CM_4_38_7]OLC91867.1 MAG: hypothetical protein AUI92_06730 [Thaumarchaeota archaeon 13_1_40CM_3_38_6]